MTDTPVLPDHIEQTLQALAELHRQHQLSTTPSQKVVARLTGLVGRPRFVGLVTIALGLWIGLNGLAQLAGLAPPDPPPFSYVQTLTGIAGVYITLLILITQRHENRLSEARAQLTLELAILNEQKSAKIIALIEEIRLDSSGLPDRKDAEAEQLSVPADPQVVLEAIRQTTEQLAEESREDQRPPEPADDRDQDA